MLITGNTYPSRKEIKALGGRWNASAQGWNVPEENAAKAQALVDANGPSTYTPRTKSVEYRFSSGAVMYRNAKGRCEDAPCCGCCS